MKKIFSKKQLAYKILESNPDIFIPMATLMEDLSSIYKIRKIAAKIKNNIEYDESLLINLATTAQNVFGTNDLILYNIIMSNDEVDIIQRTISSIRNSKI